MVDDDIVNRVVAKSHLENLGFEVDQAVDGKDGVVKEIRSNHYGFADARMERV